MSTAAPPRRPTPAQRRPQPRPIARPLRLGNARRRAGVLFIAAVIVLSAFAVRLLEIQAFRGDALAAAAVDQRSTTVTVLADRGDILDTNWVPLASSVEARNVTADQTLI
ncbi:MAG: penicillin-binding protein 2, partial [Actinomycetota bacterium]